MIKNGEIYQIGNHKYLIVSNKATPFPIGCLISNSDKRKKLPDKSYYVSDCGYFCLEYLVLLNHQDLINNIGKIDDETLEKIQAEISKCLTI